ncbi:uncharacterized protein F4822DRAFT_112995 [Hypoxylon trugodes]|uniref:uncharacterized protein n=1 Tax=Hypoxylon trugodes TaxID=326681 RepID=UPI00218DE251|nr:uncharacterized protein F4822DRAFT_112995 [Hypoxylon trugodes]KAI1392011.1 hypothetical protein F4822DRAFT_112995 [Hypoxylon trugodes]
MGSWVVMAIPSNVYQQPKLGHSAQLSPQMAGLGEASDWDTTILVTDDWMKVASMKVASERRHSGWESVEKKWSENAPAPQRAGLKPPSESTKKADEAMARFPYPHIPIPTPQLDFDFRMKVLLNSQSASVAVGDSFKKLSTLSEGTWSGRFGYGLVVNGGQESQDVVQENLTATQVEATHRLQTGDEVPAYIECKIRGNMIGQPELVKALQDPGRSGVDPRSCRFRVFITMKTSDERYANKLNAGMWVGSCLWKGLEIIYDVYRIS